MKTAIILFVLFYFLAARSWDDYDADPCAEYLHWEVNQINPYSETEIITDPYAR